MKAPTPATRLRMLWHSLWYRASWTVLAALWAVALVLGYIGLHRLAVEQGLAHSALDIIYRTLRLPTMQSGDVSIPPPWELQIARFALPILAAYTTIRAFFFVFLQRMQVDWMRNHAVICGLGRTGFLLAKSFRGRGQAVVVIERNRDNPLIDECRDNGIIVLIGDATDRDLLQRAHVQTASHVVSACTSDGTNAEVAVYAHDLARSRRSGVLTCAIRILDPQLCALLREQEIATDYSDPFRLEFFDLFEIGARAMLQEFPPFGAAEQPCLPHMLVVGLGHLGENVIIQAARAWQPRQAASGQRLTITALDRAAQLKTESLLLRYPPLQKICQIIPVQTDVTWPDFRRAAFLFDDDGACNVTIVYVCLDDDALGLAAGLAILQPTRTLNIPIVVRMTHEGGLAALLKNKDASRFGNLRGFPLLDRTCQPDLVLGGSHEIIARAMHESYLRQELARGGTMATNPSLTPWDSLPEATKELNRRQADHVGVKLQAIGCGIAPLSAWEPEIVTFSSSEVERMAYMEHGRWMEELRKQGWKLGQRDEKRKTNPYLVAWEQLPEDERELNRSLVRDIPALLARAGFEVYRLKESTV